MNTKLKQHLTGDPSYCRALCSLLPEEIPVAALAVCNLYSYSDEAALSSLLVSRKPRFTLNIILLSHHKLHIKKSSLLMPLKLSSQQVSFSGPLLDTMCRVVSSRCKRLKGLTFSAYCCWRVFKC